MEIGKTCRRCKEEKEFSAFRKDKRYTDGHASWCRTCYSEYSKQWETKTQRSERRRSQFREDWLLKKYGLTIEQFDEKLEKQGGVCAICGTDTPRGRKKVFKVDHCHSTEEVRGLLCNQCNVGLGCFKDSVDTLKKAISYLCKHQR